MIDPVRDDHRGGDLAAVGPDVSDLGLSELDLVLRASRALIEGPDGRTRQRPATVGVRGGRVVLIADLDATVPTAAAVVELAEDEVLLPGLVDSHVHVDEPGRTEWEGFASATRAAAAGGITTLVDMPLNSIPPTTTAAHLRTKQDAARGQVHVDVAFWGGAVPDNIGDLAELHGAGVLGFKAFLSPSGVPEFGHLGDDTTLRAVLEQTAALHALLLLHAEDPDVLDAAPPAAGRRYADFVASRPAAAEARAVERLLRLADDLGARVHVLHLSSAAALPALAAARQAGQLVTVETCPHYLVLDAATLADGATAAKCCPPIRGAADADALWRALADGLIDCVVSDHSPAPVDLKQPASGDFGDAWGGISSLQLALPLVWSAARTRGHDLADVVTWQATGPARVAGLARKGRIATGVDADLVVLAPDEVFTVDPEALYHRHPVSPYTGRRLSGVVRSTWLAGRRIDLDGPPHGRLLHRGDA